MVSADKIKGFIVGAAAAVTIMSAGAAFAGPVSQSITAVYNDIRIVVNGQPITPVDTDGKKVEPFVYDGTAYLPVRAVAQALNQQVFWDGSSHSVYIGTVAITDEQALQLVSDYRRYYRIVNGGLSREGRETCTHQSVQVEGAASPLDSLCGFNSVQELKQYLQETFTPEYTDQLIADLKIRELGGKLYMMPVGGGTMLSWDKAVVLSKKEDGGRAEVEFKVPYGDGKDVPDSTRKVTFQFVEGQGWRLTERL